MPQRDEITAARAIYSVDASGQATTQTGTVSNPSVVKSAGFTWLGDAQITAPTAASTALPTIPATATVAIIQNNTSQIYRFRYSGVPTASVGQRLAVGGVATLDVGQATLQTVRLIQEAAATGTIDVTYFN